MQFPNKRKKISFVPFVLVVYGLSGRLQDCNVTIRSDSFSLGSRNWPACESISIPRNVMVVAGPSVFPRPQGLPAHYTVGELSVEMICTLTHLAVPGKIIQLMYSWLYAVVEEYP